MLRPSVRVVGALLAAAAASGAFAQVLLASKPAKTPKSSVALVWDLPAGSLRLIMGSADRSSQAGMVWLVPASKEAQVSAVTPEIFIHFRSLLNPAAPKADEGGEPKGSASYTLTSNDGQLTQAVQAAGITLDAATKSWAASRYSQRFNILVIKGGADATMVSDKAESASLYSMAPNSPLAVRAYEEVFFLLPSRLAPSSSTGAEVNLPGPSTIHNAKSGQLTGKFLDIPADALRRDCLLTSTTAPAGSPEAKLLSSGDITFARKDLPKLVGTGDREPEVSGVGSQKEDLPGSTIAIAVGVGGLIIAGIVYVLRSRRA